MVNQESRRKNAFKRISTSPVGIIGLFLVLVLPFGVIFYLLISEINVVIQFAAKERLGVEYNQPVRALFEDLLDYADFNGDFVAQHPQLKPRLLASQSQTEGEDIQAIDKVDQKLGKPLNSTEKWVELKVNLVELRSIPSEMMQETRDKTINATVSLINDVGDSSNLILDPDLDTYYLMATVVTNLPSVTSSTAQARRLAASVANRGTITPAEKSELIRLSGVIKSEMGTIERNLKVAFNYNQNLRPELEAYYQNYATMNQFLALLDSRFIKAPKIGISTEEIYGAGSKALQSSFHLYDVLSPSLDRLLEARITRSADKIRLVEVFGAVVLGAATFVFLIFFRNMRERMGALEAMRQAEAKYRSIFDNAVEGIFQLSPEGKWLSANPAVAGIFGYKTVEEFMAEANGKSPRMYSDADRRREFLSQLRERGVVTSFESQCIRPDAGKIWVTESARVFRDADGGAEHIEGTIEDITERKEAEEARREVERMKNEFVSVVSHELRTPLTSIRGSLGLLAAGRMGQLSAQAQRMVGIAVSNTDRLVRLVNNILDIERLESGQIKLDKQMCDVATLMSAAADVMRPMAEKAGISLSVTPEPAQLWADPDRITQVITNLLSNAIKYSPHKGTVWLSAELRDSEILFVVKDQGRGIPSDKLESIFHRFQQVDTSDAREKGGTGLGLAICLSIAQQHGGNVWVKSKLGEGSSFFFTVPGAQEKKEESSRPEVVPAAARRVLICDDDASVRSVIGSMLVSQGYEVVLASSGQEAVERAASQHPDAIMMDIMMPGMDGWQTMAALKENSETKGVPVIVTSVLRPAAEGPSGETIPAWVQKPVDETKLSRTLEQVLASHPRAARVLLVEDDMDLARVVIATLERHGMETIHAKTGREAIELSQKTSPDLLVLDLILPEVDGFEVVSWLRRHGRLCDIPLVVYTAKDLTEQEREQLRLGASEFLTKSQVSLEEFEKRVLGLLNQVIPEKQATGPAQEV
ncbi:MAG TPA: response regulator [Terriglobia bacterium]|nr:response regulator [Terriglobia bacterium]